MPRVPIHTATIAGRPVRFYCHPQVQPGFAWVALQDLAAVAGYPPAGCDLVAKQWRETHPDMSEDTGDGAVIVSDQVAAGFLEWCTDMGLPNGEAIKLAFGDEAGLLYVRLTAHLSATEWRTATQRAALVDHIPMPDTRAH